MEEMQLIEQGANVWGECPSGANDAILWVEKAGRTCYRSEDKIIEGSGSKFVDGIIRRGHLSVIEHSNMVIRSPQKAVYPGAYFNKVHSIYTSKFLHHVIDNDYIYSGGNFRAWMEELKLHSIDDLFIFHDDFVVDQKYTPNALKLISVEFITDRAITHELVRHRPASYSQESQRYVKYNDINFIKPYWYDEASVTEQEYFKINCSTAEQFYRWFRKNAEMKAEKARAVLTNCVATKIVMTASIPEWWHVFKMRCSKAAYTGIRELMKPVRERFLKEGWQ